MGNVTLRRLAILFLCVGLIACGGAGSDETAYQHAVSLADAKEADARQLASDTPCEQAAQCGSIGFTDPRDPCGAWTYLPYSLVSSTATAAELAAEQQRALAVQARKLSTQPDVACILIVKTPPLLACIAGKCQAAR